MTNVSFPSISDYKDVEAHNAYKEAIKSGRAESDFMSALHKQGRDNARTPFQWSNSDNAGFSTGTPWIKVNPNYKEINAELQEDDPDSVLNFYRKMITVRKSSDTFTYGDFEIMDILDPRIFAYKRFDEKSFYAVMINFSEEVTPYKLFEEQTNPGEVIISNYQETADIHDKIINLRPWEAIIFKVK
jgi:glycosidase